MVLGGRPNIIMATVATAASAVGPNQTRCGRSLAAQNVTNRYKKSDKKGKTRS